MQITANRTKSCSLALALALTKRLRFFSFFFSVRRLKLCSFNERRVESERHN